MNLPPTLVCFAVKEEAEVFELVRRSAPRAKILITGMGKANAEKAIRETFQIIRPALVLSCGFAGGLNPQLASGTVVFETQDSAMEAELLARGAFGVKFHCADRVVTTAAEKRALRESTDADAVEMESQAIGSICSQAAIPFATVRVILDAADEDLPLDFNQLMTSKQEMSYFKLGGALLKSPGKIGALKKLQKRCEAASDKLAQVLVRIIPG
jgi:adenosylhomocysteine nucleosidase